MKCFTRTTILAISAALALGCARSGDGTAAPAAAGVPGQYLLASQPEGAQGVAAARRAAEDGDEVVVTGRVGGEADPFVDGAAVFTIVDLALQPCAPDEGCPTPWDYCCDVDETAANKATVKVVDDQGRTVATDARSLLNVEPLSEVVVRGRAKRDDAGNLTLLANGVYIGGK